jgi:hypothetical protein
LEGEKNRVLAVTVVLLLGEKSDLSFYCGAYASNRQKNRILVIACGEKLDSNAEGRKIGS